MLFCDHNFIMFLFYVTEVAYLLLLSVLFVKWHFLV
jgi:hypothetical protein